MSISEALRYIYSQRTEQIAIIRSLPTRYSFSENEKKIHYATTVVIIYANWEGFVKESVRIYLEHINRQEYLISHLNDTYYAYLVNQHLNLRKETTSFRAIVRSCANLRSKLEEETAYFDPNVNTKSNANCDNVNALFEGLGVYQVIDKSIYGGRIDKLLNFRNNIAHGSNTIPVGNDDVTTFVTLVEELMEILSLALNQAISQKIWLRADRDKG